MITRKVAPALAVGCTVVCKPASETPLTALALAVLAEPAGVPKGVSRSHRQGQAIGKELTSNPDVRMLTFTGSTEIGAKLMAQCAPTVKKLGIELGGNAPFIVFDDADLDKAVAGAIASKYRNAGQTCVCANRIYVQEGVYDKFAEKLAAEGQEDEGRRRHRGGRHHRAPHQQGRRREGRGARSRCAEARRENRAGRQAARPLGGNFYEPTILANVTQDMMVAREGNLRARRAALQVQDEAEAIAMANDTPFGLAAYFYARDVGRVWRVAEALECGIIGINEGIISSEVAPIRRLQAVRPRPRGLRRTASRSSWRSSTC